MDKFGQLQLENVKKFSEQFPECLNYIDLLSIEDNSYIERYEFYGNETTIVGVSPEGNFNIYGESKRELSKILDYILGIKGGLPNLILGDSRLEGMVRNKNFPIKQYRPWYCMSFRPTQIKENAEARELNESHQEIVESWYDEFNREEGSSWAVPNMKDLGEKKLYGLFENSEFIAGCANSLVNPDRLWIGRLFVKAEARRKGHAHGLMDHIENEAFRTEREVHLLVDVTNTNAINFYKSRGYSMYGLNAYWVFGK